MASTTPKLFTPLQVGDVTVQHRVVLAPLTRMRARKDHVHNEMAVEYYKQRAAVPGTMLITEATFIAPEAGGYDNIPGIYTQEQIAAWKPVSEVDDCLSFPRCLCSSCYDVASDRS